MGKNQKNQKNQRNIIGKDFEGGGCIQNSAVTDFPHLGVIDRAIRTLA